MQATTNGEVASSTHRNSASTAPQVDIAKHRVSPASLLTDKDQALLGIWLANHALVRCRAVDILKRMRHETVQEQDCWFLGRYPTKRVEIVGLLVSAIVDTTPRKDNPSVDRLSMVRYAVDDGTAVLECVCWCSELALSLARKGLRGKMRISRDLDEQLCQEAREGEMQPSEAFKVGTLVRIQGMLELFRQRRQINVRLIEALVSPSAEPRHIIECARLKIEVYAKPVDIGNTVWESRRRQGIERTARELQERQTRSQSALDISISQSQVSETSSASEGDSPSGLKDPARLTRRQIEPNRFRGYIEEFIATRLEEPAFSIARLRDDDKIRAFAARLARANHRANTLTPLSVLKSRNDYVPIPKTTSVTKLKSTDPTRLITEAVLALFKEGSVVLADRSSDAATNRAVLAMQKANPKLTVDEIYEPVNVDTLGQAIGLVLRRSGLQALSCDEISQQVRAWNPKWQRVSTGSIDSVLNELCDLRRVSVASNDGARLYLHAGSDLSAIA
ncbi:uncharacterized protein L969DRAFT_96625 [Mixia osmundae IAM 14324]|uniref:CST complex subunit STN1 n=1 Tax=Mixia osmundae (strain CBS 9802 / IAM 14324 / JCM 22182 / KY 12970) TaxID=764103 RepID=G7EB00_MIXOS|nr:uncharacterized protein L969DRAFT_96625 [Mixia osmundae IAM 14324]KEI37045.1 hypothetical protein L969DRAFT_96625 [Mixia osmundae IAM 14324]GAB00011.1 hypothetical protein E5Q_06713 [Mixia osmundae IAM 14324]